MMARCQIVVKTSEATKENKDQSSEKQQIKLRSKAGSVGIPLFPSSV